MHVEERGWKIKCQTLTCAVCVCVVLGFAKYKRLVIGDNGWLLGGRGVCPCVSECSTRLTCMAMWEIKITHSAMHVVGVVLGA